MSTFEAAVRFMVIGDQPTRRGAAPKPGTPPGDDPLDGSVRSVDVPAADAPAPPADGLSGLLERARAARARLGDQPLPIANHDVLLITRLLGG